MQMLFVMAGEKQKCKQIMDKYKICSISPLWLKSDIDIF